MKITNHFSAIVAIAMMLCVAFPTLAHDLEVDGIYYNYLDKTAKTVAVTYRGSKYSDYSNEYTGTVAIPSSVKYSGTGTTYSVTSIGENAFRSCKGLTEVTIPNSVTEIGDYAFSDCSGLIEVNISDLSAWCKIVFEGDNANPLYYAKNLKLNGSEIKDLVIPNDITEIKNYAFYNCTGLTSVTIGNSVTSIGSWAFKDCTGLTSVTIPNSVTSIGTATFSNCTGLTSVTIPNSVTSIGSSAFNRCTGLTSVTIPNSVTEIGSYSFNNCTGLTEVNYNAENCYSMGFVMGSYFPVFDGCSNLKTLNIGNDVKTIPSYAFHELIGLTSVTIPNSVTSIGKSAFYDCTSLTEVNISDLSAWCKIDFGSSAANPLSYANKLKLNGSEIKDLVIPNDITEIKNYTFYYCTGLTSVTIPNSVTSIGSYAFYNCYGLPSITIPNSVTEIGNEAFSYCSNLKIVINLSNLTFSKGSSDYGKIAYRANRVINAPNGSIVGDFVFSKAANVNSLVAYLGNANELILPDDFNGKNYIIGPATFSNCTGLISVTIPNSVTEIGDYAFSDCSSLTTVNYNAKNCISMGSSLKPVFSGCSNLKTLNIGNVVETIPNYAFYYCSGLTSVTIPNSVTKIGESAFSHCTGLTEVNFNAKNCISMGSSSSPVFSGCSNLKTLNIGNEVETIPIYAFYGCSGLTEVTIPNSVTSIGDGAFEDCTGLTEVNFNAKNCISMGSSSSPVFSGCSNLKTLNIGNEVETIPIYAFYGCSGLTSVTIPNSVTEIGTYAFRGCSGLTTVTIPNSVTKIGDRAFYNCKGLTEVNYNAENCTSMGSSSYPVFSGCSSLETLNIGNEVKTIPNYAFYNCSGLPSITIPNSVTEIGTYAFRGCDGLTEVNISDLSAWCKIVFDDYYANPLYYANKLKLNGSEIKDLVIPNDITEIKNYTFYYCTGLTSATIPNSVTKIGNNAFYGCSGLTTVTIPNSVTKIGDQAFYNCTGLTSVTIPNSVTSMGSYAFYNCTGLTSVTIGNSVTWIGSYAFYNCSGLTSVTIPNSVTPIGSYAFYNCTGLTSVTIGNSVTSIGQSAFRSSANLENIVSLNENPPVCENNSFDSENYTNSTLYVPKDSYAKYFINDVWGQFNNIVKLENLVSNISINSSSISLELGKTTTLSATVLPSSATFPNLYWESNNENVATVDQTGKVTAHSKGEAIITAKSMDGSSITASCVVKVFTYDVESITLSQHDATLAIKDKVTLKYTITPSYVTDNSVTWSNSNPSVASMAKNSDGSVTISCQEEGETIIKVTTNDGTNLSDSCKITVYRIPPTITLSKTSENLLIHNTVKLRYTITNSTINTATWSTSDATVASITSNTDGSVTVFAEAEGVATITATMIDVNGKEFSATCEITVIPPTIVLSQTVAKLPVNELLTLNYDITNSSIKNATWTTSNPDVAPIKVNSDGSVIVVGLSEGEAIITATMTEVNGVEYSASCEVTVGISGVEGIETDNNSKEIARYDIHGRLLSEPTKGINIIKMSDGSTRKEIVK